MLAFSFTLFVCFFAIGLGHQSTVEKEEKNVVKEEKAAGQFGGFFGDNGFGDWDYNDYSRQGRGRRSSSSSSSSSSSRSSPSSCSGSSESSECKSKSKSKEKKCPKPQPKSCTVQATIANGAISYSPAKNAPVGGIVPLNTIATLTCNIGYKPTTASQTSSTCVGANVWNTVLSTCQPTCTVQATIANGAISYSPAKNAPVGGIVPLDTVAILTCNIGYTPTTASQTTSTCVDENVWDTVLSTCQPVPCVDPTTLFTTQNDKMLTYTCTSGTCTGVQPYMQNVTALCTDGDTVLDVTFDNGTPGRQDEDLNGGSDQIILTCNAQGKWQTTVNNNYGSQAGTATGTISNPVSIICRAYFGT